MHTIHPGLPPGFAYATPSQRESYDEDGSVHGASKVVFVQASDDVIEREVSILQVSGPDEFPTAYYRHLAIERTLLLAVRLRPPRTWEDVISPVARKLAAYDEGVRVGNLDWYIREYNNGFAAGRRGTGSIDDKSSAAWDDGCLDGTAGRPKWHLTYCTDHDSCGEA